jgi:mannose-1-phosphate guanylyltransferase/mannose-6-phosphate isomerase
MERVADPDLFGRPIVITNGEFRFIVAEQLRECGTAADVILEPARRDSALAVAVAAVLAMERDPKSIVLALAADNLIQVPDAFMQTCREGAAAAAEGRIVTFGILPSRPATNYGYIRPGAALNGTGVRSVEAFVEKPDTERAATYVANRYLWNSGNFMFNAAVMLDEISRFEPAIADSARAAVAGKSRDLDFTRLAEEPFCRSPRKSIDYAVMERTDRAAVVPADFGWSDVGSWGAVWEMLDHDTHGNATEGPVVAVDSRNVLVHSDESILTTVVGLHDVVVVTTADAVLVTSRDKSESVKELVEQLKTKNRREAVEHSRIYRPWGYYQRIDLGSRYQVKRIVVKPGAKLSLQKHRHRSEHWVVVRGMAEVTLNGSTRSIHENESIYVPIEGIHRIANPGKIPLELIEVQVGSYLGEDDIVRLDDDYSRK